MSEIHVGDRFECIDDMSCVQRGATYVVLAVEKGRWRCRRDDPDGGYETTLTTLSDSRFWRRLPPSPEVRDPRVGETTVGQVWRYATCEHCNSTGCHECLREVIQFRNEKATYTNGWTNHVSWHDGKRMVLHSTPTDAAAGEPAKLCGKSVNGTVGKCNLNPGHDGSCGLDRVSPAAPTGAPAKVEPPRCQNGNHVLGCSVSPVRERHIRKRQGWFSDACYLSEEEYMELAQFTDDSEPRLREPPLPRDHWRPAIESLGGVRPFGRPRGRP